MFRNFVQDLRLSARLLAKSPGFTLAAVASLALGIGANTAVATFADFYLFRSLAVAHPEQLVRAHITWSSGLKYGSFSYPDYVDFRDENQVFSGFAASALLPFHLSADGRNERLYGELATANYFAVLGVEVPLGRGFRPEEDKEVGAHPVVVLQHGLWQARFGADRRILGREINLNGRPFTVIGVAAPGFNGAQVGLKTSFWVPMGMQEAATSGPSRLAARGSHWLSPIIGRLKPGVTLEQAEASLNTLMERLIKAYPEDNTGKSVTLYPESQAALHPMVRGGFAGFIGLMGGVVSLVLLLACSNVAGLILSRASARRREIAVRLALGASRGRIVGQLFSESLLLAGAAAVAGLGIAWGFTRFLAAKRPPIDFPLYLELNPSPKLLVFTIGVSFLASLLFGLLPAFQTSKPELVPALKAGSSGGRGGGRFRRLLVAGQVALSLVLLLGAGLALRSLANARHLDVGFEAEHQLVVGADLALQGYDEAKGRAFFAALAERARALPGVTAVGWARTVPLSFGSTQRAALPEGYAPPEGSNDPTIDFNVVGPGYFTAMGLPLLAGRGFEPSDGENGAPVLIVNRTFADKYWPSAEALGKRVRIGSEDYTVVGVAAAGKYFSLGESPKPYMYLPFDREYSGRGVLHVRSAGDPAALVPALRQEIAALDAGLPLRELKPMTDQLSFVLLPARLAAVVVAVFAALALLLAAIGLYAVVAQWVAQRVPEIGLRMALGARQQDVRSLVLWQGLGLAARGLAAGLVAGLLLALAATKVLYGVSATEPTAYLGAALLLGLVATAATLLPAARASRLDPTRALKGE